MIYSCSSKSLSINPMLISNSFCLVHCVNILQSNLVVGIQSSFISHFPSLKHKAVSFALTKQAHVCLASTRLLHRRPSDFCVLLWLVRKTCEQTASVLLIPRLIQQLEMLLSSSICLFAILKLLLSWSGAEDGLCSSFCSAASSMSNS